MTKSERTEASQKWIRDYTRKLVEISKQGKSLPFKLTQVKRPKSIPMFHKP